MLSSRKRKREAGGSVLPRRGFSARSVRGRTTRVRGKPAGAGSAGASECEGAGTPDARASGWGWIRLGTLDERSPGVRRQSLLRESCHRAAGGFKRTPQPARAVQLGAQTSPPEREERPAGCREPRKTPLSPREGHDEGGREELGAGRGLHGVAARGVDGPAPNSGREPRLAHSPVRSRPSGGRGVRAPQLLSAAAATATRPARRRKLPPGSWRAWAGPGCPRPKGAPQPRRRRPLASSGARRVAPRCCHRPRRRPPRWAPGAAEPPSEPLPGADPASQGPAAPRPAAGGHAPRSRDARGAGLRPRRRGPGLREPSRLRPASSARPRPFRPRPRLASRDGEMPSSSGSRPPTHTEATPLSVT